MKCLTILKCISRFMHTGKTKQRGAGESRFPLENKMIKMYKSKWYQAKVKSLSNLEQELLALPDELIDEIKALKEKYKLKEFSTQLAIHNTKIDIKQYIRVHK